MALINEQLLSRIERIIRDIEKEYRRTKGLILTEGDLKCLIYKRLASLFSNNLRPFSRFHHPIQVDHIPAWRAETIDNGIFASSVHTEIPWYNERGTLTIRPDITILEPSHLSILHGLDKPQLPSKQAEFGGQGIIVEIKFCRYKHGISQHFFMKIQKDLEIEKKKGIKNIRNDIDILRRLVTDYDLDDKKRKDKKP